MRGYAAGAVVAENNDVEEGGLHLSLDPGSPPEDPINDPAGLLHSYCFILSSAQLQDTIL